MTYTAAPTFDGGRWRDNKKEKKKRHGDVVSSTLAAPELGLLIVKYSLSKKNYIPPPSAFFLMKVVDRR